MGRTIAISIAIAVLLTAFSQASANKGIGGEEVGQTYNRVVSQVEDIKNGEPIAEVLFDKYSKEDDKNNKSETKKDKENQLKNSKNDILKNDFIAQIVESLKGVLKNGEEISEETKDGVNFGAVQEIFSSSKDSSPDAPKTTNTNSLEEDQATGLGGSSKDAHCVLSPTKKTYTCKIIEDISFDFLEDGTIRVERE